MANDEGAFARGWRDLQQVVRSLRFCIPAALLTAGFAAYGATLSPTTAGLWERIVFAVAGSLGGALVLGVLAFAVLVATAPVRQRDEARALVTTEDLDAHDFAREFSDFIERAFAACPEPYLDGLMFNIGREDLARADATRAHSVDEARRSALAEYHERFRERLLQLLTEHGRETGTLPVLAPKDLDDLVLLDDAMKQLAGE